MDKVLSELATNKDIEQAIKKRILTLLNKNNLTTEEIHLLNILLNKWDLIR